MASMHALRARVESSLAGRIAAPFSYRDRRVADTVSCGVPEIDALTGGLARGGLTEICGPPGSGRTSLLLAALAARTAQSESCALVDGRDGFDPAAAEAAGVRLGQLLWVRCRDIEQSLRATDLLVRGGGFGLIAVDLADIEPKTMRGVTLNTWFRFRRAVEDTPAILLLVEQESNAKTCASLVLRLEAEETEWLNIPQNAKEEPQGPVRLSAGRTEALSYKESWTRLLGGFGVRAERLHARVQAAQESAVLGAPAAAGAPPRKSDAEDGEFANFKTRTEWSEQHQRKSA
jgi:hypothetical protein